MIAQFFKEIFFKRETLQSFVIMILTFSTSFIGIFNQKIIIQNYGDKALELYFLVLSWFLLSSSIFKLGSRNTFVTLRSDHKNQINYFVASSIVGIISALFFGLATFASLYFNKSISFNEISFFIIPFFLIQAINLYLSFYLLSIKKPIIATLISFLNSPIAFLMLYFNLFNDFFFTLFLSHTSSLCLLIFIIFKNIDFSLINFSLKSLKYFFHKNFFKSIKFIFSEFIDILTQRVSIFFLAYYANDLSEMAEFSIALALLKVSMIGIDSIGSVFSPNIFDSIKSSKKELKLTYVRARNLFILASLISFLFILLLADIVIIYFFTEKYIGAFKILLILQAGQLIHSFFGPNALIGKLAGLPVLISTYKLLTTSFMIILNFLLYDKFGLHVLAYTYVFSLFLWNIMVQFKIRKLI